MEEENIFVQIAQIQADLKAPKGQYNKFGKYNYRSAEDIIEAIKPHLQEHGLAQFISDEVKLIGDRYYVESTVTVTNGTKDHSVTASAREEEHKKGMDGSQITGAASSYARKYALNGMWNIDDTKDSDATNEHEDLPEWWSKAVMFLKNGEGTIEDIEKKYTLNGLKRKLKEEAGV
ncbi:MAG: ERF family protein [bacterium]|nr:ERF family protein [bacterium]